MMNDILKEPDFFESLSDADREEMCEFFENDSAYPIIAGWFRAKIGEWTMKKELKTEVKNEVEAGVWV